MAIQLSELNGVEKPRFAQLVNEALFKKLVIAQSGALVNVSPGDLGLTYNEGERRVFLPYWKHQSYTHTDLTNTNTATSAQAIEAAEQIGRMIYRGNAWGTTWLAKHLVGSDPLANIAELVADYWANNIHTACLNILGGLFGDDGGATSQIEARYLDSTGDGIMTGAILKKGIYRMGDQFDKISLMLCHSSVYALLDTNEDLTPIIGQDGTTIYHVLRGTKIRVHVDDTMPRHNVSVPNDVGEHNAAVYYLAQGSLIHCLMDQYLKPKEEQSTGQTELHNRRAFLLHPQGISWQSSDPTEVGGQALTPTNANLLNKDNWELQHSIQNFAIVRQDVAVAE